MKIFCVCVGIALSSLNSESLWLICGLQGGISNFLFFSQLPNCIPKFPNCLSPRHFVLCCASQNICWWCCCDIVPKKNVYAYWLRPQSRHMRTVWPFEHTYCSCSTWWSCWLPWELTHLSCRGNRLNILMYLQQHSTAACLPTGTRMYQNDDRTPGRLSCAEAPAIRTSYFHSAQFLNILKSIDCHELIDRKPGTIWVSSTILCNLTWLWSSCSIGLSDVLHLCFVVNPTHRGELFVRLVSIYTSSSMFEERGSSCEGPSQL